MSVSSFSLFSAFLTAFLVVTSLAAPMNLMSVAKEEKAEATTVQPPTMSFVEAAIDNQKREIKELSQAVQLVRALHVASTNTAKRHGSPNGAARVDDKKADQTASFEKIKPTVKISSCIYMMEECCHYMVEGQLYGRDVIYATSDYVACCLDILYPVLLVQNETYAPNFPGYDMYEVGLYYCLMENNGIYSHWDLAAGDVTYYTY